MPVTHDQIHEMFKYCLNFAERMLVDAGEFYPFGGLVDKSGEFNAVGGDLGSERPNPRELYKFLADAFAAKAKSGEVLAAAVASNVDVPTQFDAIYPDAVRVHIEATGYARYIYVPYHLSISGFFRKKRNLTLGEPFSVDIEPQIFVGGANA